MNRSHSRLTPALKAPPRGRGWGGFSPYAATTPAILLLTTLAPAGCAYNPSPINSSLSRDEFCARLRESFRVGMSQDEVDAALTVLRLDHEFHKSEHTACEDADVQGFSATVHPGGTYQVWGYASMTWGALKFVIDENQALRCVSYKSGYFKSGIEEWSGGVIIQ